MHPISHHIGRASIILCMQFFMDLLVRRRACRRALFLTGTPAMSRPIELYTQARDAAWQFDCTDISQGLLCMLLERRPDRWQG